MTSHAIAIHDFEPDSSMKALLPGAQFGDCFRITVDDAINARQAAERMFLRQRGWISALMKLRNIMVTPFGLKRPTHRKALTRESIGPFPVISETPQRLVAGFDDRHLDFRIVVDVSGDVPGQEVSATTLVKTNNLLGRIYLTIIMPFHRLIVPAMLRNI
ncbi:DUF2867 domain-containing protein [Afipia clevelandensis]|uniref:DUF2867 domain-containing protein n=1 Tax=Afipia clevelandensis ATCC 49720 TaxID=883079 RepID=K8NVM1_9BRAD|nr:DUF2867 domain-containing protein [Afipia clevelandensis]EKS33206.1 hypothetical protein HMPREF9696_03247 [Afipia clevelandensis ATCC 49720]